MTEDEQKKKEEQLEEIVAEAPKTEQTEKSKFKVPLRYKPAYVYPYPARYGGPGKSSVPARYK